MLENPILPEIDDTHLIYLINQGYAKDIRSVQFLPIGADLDTAVYEAKAADNTTYFVKLRRHGASSEASVAVPTFLSAQGMRQMIPALRTQAGNLRHNLDCWVMTLHPFIQGHHGYQHKLTAEHWAEFGGAVKKLHTIDFPESIVAGIPREDFSSQWHHELRGFIARLEQETLVDPVAAELAAFLRSKKAEVFRLLARAEESIQHLIHKTQDFVLCHADLHCWNILIEDSNGALHIVDWDTLIFAPKERDLMFIGAGLSDSGYTPAEESDMFFTGYGQTSIDPNAISYYRCVRIIEDLVIYCRQIFLSQDRGEDRKQAIELVRTNFRPNGSIAMALGLPYSLPKR